MKDWQACVQLNGEEYTEFSIVTFEIPNELYSKLQTLIANKLPIEESDSYEDLYRRALSACDDQSVLGDAEDDDDYSVAQVWIKDPGDLIRFKEQFIGQRILSKYISSYDEEEHWVNVSIDYQHGKCFFDANCTFDCKIDDQGRITDITDPEASALIEIDMRGSDVQEIFPDYKKISDRFKSMCEKTEQKN